MWWICVSPCVTGDSLPPCPLGFTSTEPQVKIKHFSQSDNLLPYPKFALEVKGIQQFDNVMVVAGGQNVDLHHVILQLILRLCVNNLGSSKGPGLLVLSLLTTEGRHWLHPHNTEHIIEERENKGKHVPIEYAVAVWYGWLAFTTICLAFFGGEELCRDYWWKMSISLKNSILDKNTLGHLLSLKHPL